MYFPVFGLNTERYFVSLYIHFESGEIRTRKNSVFGHFSQSVVEETNLYKVTEMWLKHNTNLEEMQQFFGMNKLMYVVKMSKFELCWSKLAYYKLVASVMGI